MEQIFMQDEVKDIVFDVEKTEEWVKLVSELNLDGQKNLVDKSSDGKQAIPFVLMNKSMEVMFEVLCPKKIKVKDYSSTPIPLKVLGAIKLAEMAGYFSKIEVWSDEQEPDPIAVGYSGDVKYLIARWGAEALSFDILMEKAKKRLLDDWKHELEDRIEKAHYSLKSLESLVYKKLKGEWVYI